MHNKTQRRKTLRRAALLPLLALLPGCEMVLMSPAGDVAVQQRNLILASTGLMLLIVLPVIVLTLLFAWTFRQSNTEADYDPDWHHSTQLEVVIWATPLVIIVALGGLTWIGSHLLDPWRPIERIDPSRPVAENVKPLTVEVVALDWKWLFIYPEQGIAALNEAAAPVNVPLTFHITSSTVMNSFFIPALAGQIYAMPGMRTTLHAVLNQPGTYQGFSANYSGAGFSDMHFAFHGMNDADFGQWVGKVKAGGGSLGRKEYLDLEKPSEREPVRHYGTVDAGLFNAVLNMCVDPSKPCTGDIMRVDRQGGQGKAEAHRTGVYTVASLGGDKQGRSGDAGSGERPLGSICTAGNATGNGAPPVAEPVTIAQRTAE